MVYLSMGFSWTFSLMRYGTTWRTHRRLFHRFFNVSAADRFDDKIYEAVGAFLRRLLESPERFLKHVHLYVGPSFDHCITPDLHYIPFDRKALPDPWPCRLRMG